VKHEILVKDGALVFVYHDDLRPLFGLGGEARTARASHVEPTSDNRWTADLSPVGGPVLGPFDERSEALKAEVAWLNQYVLGVTR